MKIGFMGLGKLGLPCSLAMESKGHTVIGYDPSEKVKATIETRNLPYKEEGAQELLTTSRIKHASIKEVVKHSEIIFVAIQTPHNHLYEGVTRLPSERVDFDYSWLKSGVKDLSAAIEELGEDKVVIIISTVLPGTLHKEVKPLLGPHVKLCYNPFFIAMGTTIQDFLNPELVLFGVDDESAANKAEEFYGTLHSAPFYRTTVENAELIKVMYNTFISTKISFVNTVMEMCHKLPNTDVDDVIGALKLCGNRIISDKYFDGGMGDGGGCHPRDNIALSWLSRKLELSHDWFENIMLQRERQTEWLADLIEEHLGGRAITILGKSFKPETNITTGSPSILLKNLLEERGHTVFMWDPYSDGPYVGNRGPQVYFVGTKHLEFTEFPFERGSVILDPWRYIPTNVQGCEVIPIGIGPE